MLRIILPLFAVVFLLTATHVEDEVAPPDPPAEPAESDAPGSTADDLERALQWSYSVNAGVFAVARDIVDGPAEARPSAAPLAVPQPAILTEIGAGLARLGAGWAQVMAWMQGDEAAFVDLGEAVADLGVPSTATGR